MVTSGQDPTCEKELKKSSEPGVVVHAFNPSSSEAEAGRSEFKASLVYRESSRTAKIRQ